MFFFSNFSPEAVQHERGPRTSTVRRQLQGLCYAAKNTSVCSSPPLDLTPKRSPECSITTCSSSTPPGGRYVPDTQLHLSAFRPQVPGDRFPAVEFTYSYYVHRGKAGTCSRRAGVSYRVRPLHCCPFRFGGVDVFVLLRFLSTANLRAT